MLPFLTGITVFHLRQTSCKSQQSRGECAVKAAEPGKLIGIGTADVRFLQFRGGLMDVWLLQLSAQAMESLFV